MDSGKWTQRVRLRQLRVLLAVAEQKSLLKAGEMLGLSQPAVTKALQELEAELDIELFRRTNRGAEPTTAGLALIRHAELVMAQLERAADTIAGLRRGFEGVVNVGTLVSASAYLLPRAIAALHAERPRIVVSLLEGTYDMLTPALLRDDLDLIVGRLPELQFREGLLTETLYEEKVAFVVRAGHPLMTRGAVTAADLREWPWILPPTATTLRRIVDRAFMDQGVAPPVPVCSSMSMLANRELIVSTDMIGAWPESVARNDLHSGLLGMPPCDFTVSFGPVGISWSRSGVLSPPALALIDRLRRVAVSDPAVWTPERPDTDGLKE